MSNFHPLEVVGRGARHNLKWVIFFKCSPLRVETRTCVMDMDIYCRSGNFRVFRFSRICDFGTSPKV